MLRNDSGTSSTNARPQWSRKQRVINPSFQWKYTLTLALTAFVVCSAMSLALYGVLHQQARMRATNPESAPAAVATVILCFGAGFGLVSAIALGIWSIFVTHRICGPLFVLSGYFTELGTGRIPKPRPLRKKDEFKDLYATFKKTTESLRSQRESELAALTQAEAIAHSVADGDLEACQHALESIANRLAELRKQAMESLGEEFVANSTTSPDKKVEAAPSPVGVG